MKNYIHKDPKWFYRQCFEIMFSDDRTIRHLVNVFSGRAKEYQRNYNLINKAELNRKQNQKYANLPMEIKLQRLKENRERNQRNKSHIAEIKRKRYNETYPKLRLAALEFYGNGKLACVCCGENNTRFLTIDHVNNDGKQHRMKVKAGNLLRWMKNHNFPKGFQTLCWNCNCGRALNKGICPHKEQKSIVITTDWSSSGGD